MGSSPSRADEVSKTGTIAGAVVAGAVIEEQFFVSDFKAIEILSDHPELIIDHPSEVGFELYGPKGTEEFLKNSGISYQSLTHDHQKDSEELLSYPSYEQVVDNLRSAVALNPSIAKMFSIGKSVQGRELWVVKISDNVNQDEKEPEFKYISSMHGDEITGRELTQFFIRDLIQGYGVDSEITSLIDNTEIYILASMNPDGSELRQRANANRVDLNRNFPDWVRGHRNDRSGRQPETMAVMNFQAQRNFSLSANFHGGAVVVNYPWDNTYDRHPLDNLLKELSLKYADLNPSMRNSRSFNRGITNGADWYRLFGGMQDWSYYWYNDLQVTVELSKRKWPNYRNIPGFYQENKASMMAYLKSIHQGAGFLTNTDASGTVKIKRVDGGQSQDMGEFAFSRGEFFKVLPVGQYEYSISTGRYTRTVNVEVDKTVQTNGNYLSL